MKTAVCKLKSTSPYSQGKHHETPAAENGKYFIKNAQKVSEQNPMLPDNIK